MLQLAVAGILFTQGRKKMAEVSPVPERTVETVKEDGQTAKDSLQKLSPRRLASRGADKVRQRRPAGGG